MAGRQETASVRVTVEHAEGALDLQRDQLRQRFGRSQIPQSRLIVGVQDGGLQIAIAGLLRMRRQVDQKWRRRDERRKSGDAETKQHAAVALMQPQDHDGQGGADGPQSGRGIEVQAQTSG